MPRSELQKLKLCYVIEIMKRYTDEEHTISITEIIERLADLGVKAERKSIYRDFSAMETLGYEIIQVHTKTFKYYLANHDFETAEIRMLVDAVQASRFITKKKSNALIKKLERLTTVYNARFMQSQVFVTNRIKTSNESIYYNVDTIHNAIHENSRISFTYYDWSMTKRRVLRHGGERYNVSPWMLIWNNENYYLIGYETQTENIKHYRVDRMLSIELTNEEREGRGAFSDIDVAEYSKKFFGMYNGKIETVELNCAKEMTNAVIDRFGTDVKFIVQDDDTFNVSVKVAVSPVFLSWVFMFGGQIKIVSPTSAADRLVEMAKVFTEG